MASHSKRPRVMLDILLVIDLLESINHYPEYRLKELADHLGVSRTYLYTQMKILKKYLGMEITNFGSYKKPLRSVSDFGFLNKDFFETPRSSF